MYCLTIWRQGVLKSLASGALLPLKPGWRTPPFVLPGFWWLTRSLGFQDLKLKHFHLCLPHHRAFSLGFCVSSLLVSTMLVLHKGLLYSNMTSLELLTASITTPFLNQVTLGGLGSEIQQTFGGDTI